MQMQFKSRVLGGGQGCFGFSLMLFSAHLCDSRRHPSGGNALPDMGKGGFSPSPSPTLPQFLM